MSRHKTTTNAWHQGYAAALAEIWNQRHDGLLVRQALSARGLTPEYLERGGAERSDLAVIREALRPSAAITDDQIRLLCREDPRLLDTLMIAIHGTDRELRDSARTHFAMLQEASGRVP